jgi:hypothetical protein
MKKIILSLAFIFITGSALSTSLISQPVAAASGNNTAACSQNFLTFLDWYSGMLDSKCNIKNPNDFNTAPSGKSSNGLSNFIWHIVLNVIEDALILVAYVAAFFILYGGFQFLTSQGTPDAAAKARTTILNAVIGLVI